jgi:TM2 domain-containing membrane protein YozV
MKRSIKAALLSGLVFPGLGHIYLRRYVQGILLGFGAALAIYFVVSTAVHTALDVAEKIEGGGVPLDVKAITDLVSQQSRGTAQLTNIATIALLAFWAIGIADSYRVGRAQERAEDGTDDERV